jgi:hypothetical protein
MYVLPYCWEAIKILIQAVSKFFKCTFTFEGKSVFSINPVGFKKLVHSSVSSQSKMITG